MATRSLIIIAQVKDAASAALNKINGSLNKTGAAAKSTSVNFTEFNRVLFSMTAFVGVFTKVFDTMIQGLNSSAELDRISDQFEKTVGPKGNLFRAISAMTSSSIDRMEAMRSGMALHSMGITKDTGQLAEVIARAGSAAKKAGFNSAEGIKRVTSFLKDGSIANLSFLHVLGATNPALQAQMAILQRAGGVMGTVISTQAKLALGMSALRAATKGMATESRDLRDVMDDVTQSFLLVRGEAGRFIGKALSPMLEKVTDFNFVGADLIERITKTDKTLIKTAKNFFIVGSALTFVIATLGTAKLLFKALGALGVGGIPFLAISLLGLAAAFTDVEKATAQFTNFLKGAGAVLLGVGQLVSSFVNDSDNFAKGIGMMDSELHAFLQKQGLLELTKTLSRTGATIIMFTKDVGNTLVNWFKTAADFVDPLIKKFKQLFKDSNPTGWARTWIEGGEGVRGLLINLTAGAITAFGAFKALQLGKGLLSKIPVIGSLFKGSSFKGSGPEGSQRDPIYTRDAAGLKDLGFFDKIKNMFRPQAQGPMLPGQTSVANPDLFLGLNKQLLKTIGTVALFTTALAAAALVGFSLGEKLNSMMSQDTANSIDDFLYNNSYIAQAREQTTEKNSELGTSKEGQAIVSALRKRDERNNTTGGIPNAEGLASVVLMAKAIGLDKVLAGINSASAGALNIPGGEALIPGPALTNAGGNVVGQATIPSMPSSEAEKREVLAASFDKASESDRITMQKAMQTALTDTKTPGMIDADEWRDIFILGINQSKLTEIVEKDSKKPEKPNLTKTTRC